MFRIILGIIFVAVGFLMVWKTDWFLQTFGEIPFAQKLFSLWGSSRTFYNLAGVLLIFIGFSLIFNLWGKIATWILSPLINPLQ